MRTLAYKVTGQRLVPVGDHTGIIAGTEGYLKAEFELDNNWDECDIVASFFVGDEEHADRLDDNMSCSIPVEVLTSSIFEMRLEGRKNNYRILTNRIRETQSGGEC